tara:strand:- start:2324 stop:3355 length:1032 start_codon:yes stop_codon:yes gene_type:complete
MILIDSSFWSTVGVISSNGNPNGNQYGFYNSIDMSNAVTIYNQYEFFKNSPINGVYYNNQYEWYKAIGVFHSEPIFDQYSFYQNVTFDGVNKVGNQYNFFKLLTAAISGDFLQGIFSTYNFTNMWSSENLTISGTTTTFNDYSGEHDLTNPAAANQATYSAIDVDFNNKPSLTYDNTDDYNYKSTNDFRIGDNEGAIYITFRTGAVLAANHTLFCVADEATNIEKILIYISIDDKISMAVGTSVLSITTSALAINTNYVLRIQSNGSAYSVTLNNVAQTIVGTNNGLWFNDFTLLSNISVGSRVNAGGALPFNGKLGLVGYTPLLSAGDDTVLVNELMSRYGI